MWRSEARRATTSMRRSAKSKFIALRIGRSATLLEARRTDVRTSSARLRARRGHAVDLGDRGAALPDLLEAVLVQAAHPLAHGDLGDAVGRGALDGQRTYLLGHGHDLVEADAPAIARAAAARAADGLVGLDVGQRGEAVVAHDLGREDRAALAVLAQRPGQALGDDAVQGAGDEEGLDAHLDEAADRARRVVGVQRREDEVARERALDGDLGGLPVADLADHDDVGVGAHHGAQPAGEGQAGARVDLDLRDALDLALDRVLDGDDVLLGRVDLAQRRVERRRLARAGRARDEDGAVGLAEGLLEALALAVGKAELAELGNPLGLVEDAHDDRLAVHAG